MENLQIAAYAEHRLLEAYKAYRFNHDDNISEPLSISDWCKVEADSDPDFYRFLFDNDAISDFGSNLSEAELKSAMDFFDSLENTLKL